MAKAADQDRRGASMKSLLARIEAETPVGGNPASDRTAGERAVEALRAELEAAERRPDQRIGYPRPVSASEPNVFQTRLRRPEPPHLPVPTARHLGSQLEPMENRTEDRDLPPLLGRPVMLAAAAFCSAIVTAAAFWMFFGPRDGAKVASVRETAAVRTIESRVVTSETAALPPPVAAQPVQTPAPAASIAIAPPQAPAAVPAPEQRPAARIEPPAPPSPPPAATTAVAMAPNLAAVAPPQVPSATAVRLQVDQAFAVRAGTRVALPIRLDPPNATEPGTRVVLRGLPPNAVVPQATRGPAGSLVIPADAIAGGVLDVAGAKTGESEIEIELQSASNQVLDRTTAMLAIVPNQATPPPAPRPDTQSTGRGDTLLARGRTLFASGDIAGARLMFERAVESGSPAAALLLGETFDPQTLAARGVRGMAPDIRQARTWYERAKTLGVAEADERLRRLPQQ